MEKTALTTLRESLEHAAATARLLHRPTQRRRGGTRPALALPPLQLHQTLHPTDARARCAAVPEVQRRWLRSCFVIACLWSQLTEELVPARNFTREESPLLMTPSALTSDRKFVAPAG